MKDESESLPRRGGWDFAGDSDALPETESVACDLCGAERSREVLRGHDFRYSLPGSFIVRECVDCGLAYTSPRPTRTVLGRYYPAEYASHAALRREHAGRLGERIRRFVTSGDDPVRQWTARIYNSLAFRAFVPAARPGLMLDVGCGRGHYLAAWQRLGWTVEGVEPSPGTAQVATEVTGAKIHNGFVEDVELPEGRYDLVSMVHCLEHARSPKAMLGAVRRVLRPGGRVLIMVPNFASWERRIFGWRWYGLELPRHLYHFTPRSLGAILTDAGFTSIHVGCSSQPDVPYRSLRLLAGMPAHNARGSPLLRAIGFGLMAPAAVLRRSTNLWAIASLRPDTSASGRSTVLEV